MSQGELAQRHGYTRRTTNVMLCKAKIGRAPRPKKEPPAKVPSPGKIARQLRNQKIVEYAKANPNETCRQIGVLFGLYLTTVSEILRDAGIHVGTGGRRVGGRKPSLKQRQDEMRARVRSVPQVAKSELKQREPSQPVPESKRPVLGYQEWLTLQQERLIQPEPEQITMSPLMESILAYARANPEMYRQEIADHFQCSEATVYAALKHTDAMRPERAREELSEEERARLIAANLRELEFTKQLAAHFAVHKPCPNGCVGRMPASMRTKMGLSPWEDSINPREQRNGPSA